MSEHDQTDSAPTTTKSAGSRPDTDVIVLGSGLERVC